MSQANRTCSAGRHAKPVGRRLSAIERAVVEVLARRPGQPMSPEQLLPELWRADYFVAERALHEHLQRLAPWLVGPVRFQVLAGGVCVLHRNQER